MNAESTNPSAESDAKLRKRKPWVRTVILAGVVFLAGGIVGGAGTVLVIKRQLSEFIRHPEDAPDRVMPWIKRRFRLDEEQTIAVERLVAEHHERLQKIRYETTPRVRRELAEFQAGVDAVLRPEQRELWNRRLGQMTDFWFPELPALPERETKQEEKTKPSQPVP